MSHLNDKLADFVFGELSASEIAEAQSHIRECADCRNQVELFQHTHALLKASPDVDPPRPMVFEIEKSRTISWVWRWVGPMTAAAAVAMAVVTFAPRQRVVERVVVQQPQQSTAQPVAQPVDYERIINELRASQQTWLANELERHDAAQSREIQSIRGQLALLDAIQRRVWKETIDNASSIQLLAQR